MVEAVERLEVVVLLDRERAADVRRVADERVSERAHVHAQLVAAARLRRELEAEMRASSAVRGYDDHFQRYRARIDSDESGPHKPEGDNDIDFYHETPPAKSMKPSTETIVKSTIAYDATVHEREFIWEVSGLSWLPCASA